MLSIADLHKKYLEAANQKDLSPLREFLDSDFTYTTSGGETARGVEAGIAENQKYLDAFPDVQLEITNQYTPSDNVSVIEFTARGTHEGELEGIKPTGKKIEMMVCTIVEGRDGKIYKEREYFDNLALLQQLGAMEAPAKTQYGQAAGSQ